MLTRKTLIALLVMMGAVVMGTSLVLAYNLGARSTAAPTSGILQDDGPTNEAPAPVQPQVSVSTSVTPEPAQPQVNVSTTEAPTPAQPQVDGSTIKTRDELLVEAGAAAPGFGGFFTQMRSVDLAEIRFQCGDPTLKKREDNIFAIVYMLDTTQQAEARRALEIIMGAEYVARRVREVRTEQGQYSISQLSQWYELIKPLVSADGVWRIDLAERINRIRVDVGVHEASHQVEAELDRLGVPREALRSRSATGHRCSKNSIRTDLISGQAAVSSRADTPAGRCDRPDPGTAGGDNSSCWLLYQAP